MEAPPFLKLNEIKYQEQPDEQFIKYMNTSFDETFSDPKLNPKLKSSLIQSLPFLQTIIPKLFWYAHFTLHVKPRPKLFQALKNEIGRLYAMHRFEKNDRLFYDAFPYFASHVIHHLFILVSQGNPQTVEKEFRRDICATIVKFLTGMRPMDNYLMEHLSKYFPTPPMYDIPEQNLKKDVSKDETVLLPIEDVNTLYMLDKMDKPQNEVWRVAALSPVVAAATRKELIENEMDTKVDIVYPKNKKEIRLPELLPDIKKTTEYKPLEETRSLIQRSRRPDIIKDYSEMKEKYFKTQETRKKKNKKLIKSHEKTIEGLNEIPLEVLTRFTKDLRELQMDHKRNVTPSFRMEEAIQKKDSNESEPELEYSDDIYMEEEFEIPYFDDCPICINKSSTLSRNSSRTNV